jgi:threonine/homoserine/homoserine lactone efflux protein
MNLGSISPNIASMNYNLFTALCGFAFVTSITPGPNNLMLMASGANFGIRRTLPHWLGVSLGFVLMASIVGLGVGRVLDASPVLKNALRAASSIYLLWLAWKIATAARPSNGAVRLAPLSFVQAAAFQWLNPKVWAMALTAISLYAPGGDFLEKIAVAVVFGVVNFPSVGIWTIAGQRLKVFLMEPERLRVFNVIMAMLLVASLLPLLFH